MMKTINNVRTKFIAFALSLVCILTLFPITPAHAATVGGFNGWGYTTQAVPVYSASTGTSQSGSLGGSEGITILEKKDNRYYVDYSTSSGAKKGWVDASKVVTYNYSIAGVATSSATVYYYHDYHCSKVAGSISAGEIVSILCVNSDGNTDSWGEGMYYYIEYNTTSGRKRGYVSVTSVRNYYSNDNTFATQPHFSSYNETYHATKYISGYHAVYRVPNNWENSKDGTSYVQNEDVIKCGEITVNGVHFWFIEYWVGNRADNVLKSGYIIV